MPYVATTLVQTEPYNLDVAISGGSVAVTVLSIRRDRISEAETLLNPPKGDRTINNGVARIVFMVHAQRGAQGMFTLRQAGTLLAEEQIGGTAAPLDLSVTFDVA